MVRPAVREVVAAELERLAGHDVTPGHDELHHYWTKGEGLAKWVHSAHPWTALYHHLVKHVPPEMAKRMASAWFHEVLGFWPGTPHVGAVPTPKAGRSAAIREVVAAELEVLRKFNPHQPRVPKGAPGGGQFGKVAHAISEAVDDGLNRPPHQNGHGGGVRPALSSAKTIGEVNGAIAGEAERITGRKIHVDLSGSDVQIAREHGEGVLRGFERFPNAPVNRVVSYGSRHSDNAAMLEKNPQFKDAYAFKQSGHAGDTIAFNNAHARNPKAYYATAGRDKLTGFSTTSGPIGNSLHEFGHSVATVNIHTESRVERRAEELSHAARKDPGKHVSAKISHYATTNRHELAAEAFADVMMNGKAASPLSHDLFGIIERGYKEPWR